MGGLGGAVGLASRTHGYSLGCVTRRMAGDERNDLLERVLISCLD